MAAADDPPAPAPAATDNAAVLASLYQDYNPQGAMGGLFAPAYIHGLKASEDAVAAWNAANHQVNYGNIDQTRMPNAYQGPSAMSGGDGRYGGPIPLTQVYGDQRGIIDPQALQALAQGGKYDFNARRDAIAARIAANAQAQAASAAPVAAVDPLALKTSRQQSVPYQDYNNVGA